MTQERRNKESHTVCPTSLLFHHSQDHAKTPNNDRVSRQSDDTFSNQAYGTPCQYRVLCSSGWKKTWLLFCSSCTSHRTILYLQKKKVTSDLAFFFILHDLMTVQSLTPTTMAAPHKIATPKYSTDRCWASAIRLRRRFVSCKEVRKIAHIFWQEGPVSCVTSGYVRRQRTAAGHPFFCMN